MRTNILRICAMALALVSSQLVFAHDDRSIEGVWDVRVTVTDCQTGAIIRTVRSIQGFSQHGVFTETANTFLRGSSVGAWNHDSARGFSATYWFFRYKPDGTFSSIAQALDKIQLSDDGKQFAASGTIQDFDANNTLISTGCFVHAATRLSKPAPGN